MFDEMIRVGAQNGLWALFSVCLLIWTLKENKEREKEYRLTIKENQNIINKLSDTINIDLTVINKTVTSLKEDVGDIKEVLK